MHVNAIATTPIEGQLPGTSGLRKKVAVFQQPRDLENFVQSVFDVVPALAAGTLVLGGDGRHHNDRAIQTILRMAAANGVAKQDRCTPPPGAPASSAASLWITDETDSLPAPD